MLFSEFDRCEIIELRILQSCMSYIYFDISGKLVQMLMESMVPTGIHLKYSSEIF